MVKKEEIRIDIADKALLERLAETEHIQWMEFTKHLLRTIEESNSIEKLKSELTTKWEKNWIPYHNLSENEKDKDRKWASEIINILVEYRSI